MGPLLSDFPIVSVDLFEANPKGAFDLDVVANDKYYEHSNEKASTVIMIMTMLDERVYLRSVRPERLYD